MFEVTPTWKSTYPDAHVGVLVMRAVSNPAHDPVLESRKSAVEDGVRAQFSGQERATIASHPILQAYNEYYRRFNNNTFAKDNLEKQGFSGKVEVFYHTNLPRKAHARDCSTFTKYCPNGFTNSSETDEPGDLWSVDQQWSDHDVGNFPLDRRRRELSNHPTLVSQSTDLAANHVDLVHEPLVESGP
jgi:hypothetical protein